MEVYLKGQFLQFGFDSGSATNILDLKKSAEFEDCMHLLGEIKLTGFGEATQTCMVAQICDIELGEIRCKPMKTLLLPLKKLNRVLPGPPLDGIIGYEFIRQYRTAINFKKNEIYVWGPELAPKAILNHSISLENTSGKQ